jgi:hypothetical protein
MLANSEVHGPEIGGWDVARNVSEWIEIGAVLVIAITVAVAVVLTVRTARAGDWAAANDEFKCAFSGRVLIGLD